MPTYEYRCLAKGHRFEKFQGMSEKPLRVCPVCGGRSERVISGGAGLLFKGNGFYATDYRSAEYRSKEKAERDVAAAKPAVAGGSKPAAGGSPAASGGGGKP